MAALAAARAKAAAAATEAEPSEDGDEQEDSSPDEEHAEEVEEATGQCQRDAACVRGIARDAKHRSCAFSPTTTSRPLTSSRASTRFQSWRPRREMQLEEAANGFS